MAKNIVIFSDGTGQEGGKGNNSNVYKLFNIVEDRTQNQIVFYEQGLGTGVRKFTGNVAGMGILENFLTGIEFQTSKLFEIFNNVDQELMALEARKQSKQDIFTMYEQDEEMSGVRANFDYGNFIKAHEELMLGFKYSRHVASESLLQLAKQALSIASSGNPTLLNLIKKDEKGSVIFAGRNQAMHFEESKFKKHTIKVFKKLELENGAHFSLKKRKGESLAYEVISESLCWENFEDMSSDLLEIEVRARALSEQ